MDDDLREFLEELAGTAPLAVLRERALRDANSADLNDAYIAWVACQAGELLAARGLRS